MMKYSTLFECGPLPPTSTLCPSDVIHVISVPRPSLFFTALPLPCFVLNAKEQKWGKHGNEVEGSMIHDIHHLTMGFILLVRCCIILG